MAPEERLAVAAELSDALRRLVESGVRSRHPDHAESKVQVAITDALLGPELAADLRRRQSEPIE